MLAFQVCVQCLFNSNSRQERHDLVKMRLFVIGKAFGITEYGLVALAQRSAGKRAAASPAGLIQV
jgi:hypothetical protein